MASVTTSPGLPPGRMARMLTALGRARLPRLGGVWIWLLLLGVFLFLAVAGASVAPHEFTVQDPRSRLLPMMASTDAGTHIAGTDGLGRDLLSWIIVGTRLTLVIGLVATAAGAIIGTTIGMLSGYFGGWVDRVGMRLAEAQTAMPMFLVAILLLSVLGPSVANLIIVLPALIWPTFARIVRAETIRLKATPYVEAAEALGCHPATVLARHLLPNLAGRIGVLLVISTGHVMLAEAGLSFLGVGVQPPDVTWGLLIARGRQYLAVAWWLTILPGLALGLLVLSLNMVGRHFERNTGAAG